MAQLTQPLTTPPKDRFVKHANWMSLLTIFSRVFGLVRDKMWSSYLGLGPEFAAFWMGFQFPNLFRRIFGEGALTAVFVPIYTQILHEHGQEKANRLVAATSTLLITFLGSLTILGELILIPLALSPSVLPSNRLAAAMIAIMLPYCCLVCFVALLAAIASVHEKFTAQSLSPVILNIVGALGAALPVWLFTAQYPLHDRVFWAAISVLVAGVLQVLQMLPTIYRSGVRLSVLFDVASSGVRPVITTMLPMMIGLSAVQFNTFMDGQIAWWLSPDGHNGVNHFLLFGFNLTTPMGPGALAKLSAAQRIYMLPVGIFGVSMATAIFPLLSKAAAQHDLAEVKRLLTAGLRKTLFLSLPASAGMILIAHPLITLIYSGKNTSIDDINRAAWAADWFCAGIWAFEAQLVILRVFYALRDTRTPMRIALLMVLLNFLLNITLVWFMQEGGVAASTTIAAIIQSTILLLILHRRLGSLGLSALRSNLLKGLTATAVMIAVAAAAQWAASFIPLGHHERKTELLLWSLIHLPIVITSAGLSYAAAAYLLRMPELKDMPFLGRFFRRLPGLKS